MKTSNRIISSLQALILLAISILVTSCGQGPIATKSSASPIIWSAKPIPKDGIEAMKRHMVIVFDKSGSMSGSKLDEAKVACAEFITSLPSNTDIGLVAFPFDVTLNIGTDRDVLKATINTLGAGGSTPLTEATAEAFNALQLAHEGSPEESLSYIVIVTDGEANNKSSLAANVGAIKSYGVKIITIGFKIEGGHSLNTPDPTGQAVYYDAKDSNGLRTALSKVVAELEDPNIPPVEPTTLPEGDSGKAPDGKDGK